MGNRISFNISDAEHIYEWLIGAWGQGWQKCPQCNNLENRLKDFIGHKVARKIRQTVEEHPYGD